ncbi:hypothetical protein [Sphingomonas nostoxanthinifaciens]|uniref:hypothetical protein n=1 Tax=Sphingomonas nostoxanthinifaciens TaxID=2872652 RepID=UPI001CC21004|nr:hypothetical protein [Sphingomonas nostoxanthinifaciens]UAK23677.1 hypothetical protein K8P63_14995 [Sphingomonas nostoxanthinifaciens]
MTQLTPATDAAFSGWNPTIFGSVFIALPGYPLGLLDGSAELSFGGRAYLGRDPTYGVLATCAEISDGTGDDAPQLKITIYPANDAAAADLAAPNMQGSQVLIHVGAVNPATGLVIPDPHQLFFGELDVPTLNVRANSRDLEYTVISVFERCLADDEGQRLSPGRQRAIYANDAGLDDVTGVGQPIDWGVAGDSTAVTYSYSGGLGASTSYGGMLQER